MARDLDPARQRPLFRGPTDGEEVAAVTGAASGIGRAVALRLGREGYAVGCMDVDTKGAEEVASEINAAGGVAHAFCLDVSSGEQVAHAFGELRKRLGPPLVLVHSAGVLSVCPALELAESEWHRVIDVNLTGTFLCDQTAARLMRDEGRGRIVNVASVHSVAPGWGVAHYDASKSGVAMLTRTLALELAPLGITVNAVAPGLVVGTRLVEGSNEAYLERVVPSIPLRRAGTPEDVAGAVAYLCSTDASYVTGAFLTVDGGMLLTTQT